MIRVKSEPVGAGINYTIEIHEPFPDEEAFLKGISPEGQYHEVLGRVRRELLAIHHHCHSGKPRNISVECWTERQGRTGEMTSTVEDEDGQQSEVSADYESILTVLAERYK